MAGRSESKKKTSAQQIRILVEFIAENTILLHGKSKQSIATANMVNCLWEDVTRILNSCASGPSKSKEKWKKTFIDWKCHTKRKARDLHRNQLHTGGGEASCSRLTPAEDKLMSMLTSSSLQKAAKAFSVGQATTLQIIDKMSGKEFQEDKVRELDLKEIELKIRLMEARNRTRELELKERELNLLEAKALSQKINI